LNHRATTPIAGPAKYTSGPGEALQPLPWKWPSLAWWDHAVEMLHFQLIQERGSCRGKCCELFITEGPDIREMKFGWWKEEVKLVEQQMMPNSGTFPAMPDISCRDSTEILFSENILDHQTSGFLSASSSRIPTYLVYEYCDRQSWRAALSWYNP